MPFKKKSQAPAENEQKKKNQHESIFPEGFIVFKPHQKAPDFILADIIVNPEIFYKWLEANSQYLKEGKYGEQLKLQLKESKSGTYYLEVNTFVKA